MLLFRGGKYLLHRRERRANVVGMHTLAVGQRYQSGTGRICQIAALDHATQTLSLGWMDGGGFASTHWTFEDFRSRNWTLLPQDAPPQETPARQFLNGGKTSCPASKTGNPIDCGGCPEHVPAAEPLKEVHWVQEKAGPKCENVDCYTPFQNVAKRYSPIVNYDGIKIGVALEMSCEPCNLRDEEDWADRTGYIGTTNVLTDNDIPARIDRRLKHAAGMHDDDLIG